MTTKFFIRISLEYLLKNHEISDNGIMSKSEQVFNYESKLIKFLLKAFFFIVHLAIMTEIVAEPKLRHIIRLAFFLYLSKPYYKTIKNRYYTFWTFSALLMIYLLFKIFEQYELAQVHIAILYAISTFILLWKMYLLSSPIYYPRFNWWEYDFRYRDDLNIIVKMNDTNYDGRLTDLRRHAGCIALFEEVEIGKEIMVSATVKNESVNLRGIVMSRRRELLGRPYIYGIQFKFDSRTNKKRYSQLVSMWEKDKNNKRKIKFANATEI